MISWPVIIALFVFIVGLPFLLLALNRGRLTRLPFVISTGYATLVAAPVFLKGLLQQAFPTLLYCAVVAALLLPSLAVELFNTVKGRRPPMRFITYALGIIPLSLSPLFGQIPMMIMVLFGIVALVLFFIQQYRYSGLNGMLIESLAREAASAAGSGFKWSSKPVTVGIGASRQYWIVAPGLRAALKTDRSIVWMKRSCHKRLGEPNLEVFSKIFIEKFLEGKT